MFNMITKCFSLFALVATVIAQDQCVREFNTVGQCLQGTIGNMHQQTLDPNTRAAIDACFTPYLCKTPDYDASNFGSLPEGLSSIGEGMLQRWFALPESKRICVRQRLYVERKKLIEDCYGGPVPDVGDNPEAQAKGNAHRQALINVEAAQQACHTKLGGAEVTKACVPNAYKTQNKANKCLIFQGCARNIVSGLCISNFQNQYGKYCMCREKAYSQSISSIITFGDDLDAFQDAIQPATSVSDTTQPAADSADPVANPVAGLFGSLGGGQSLLGSGASNLFGGAASQLTSLFGGASGGNIGNILGGGVDQAKGLIGSLLGGGGAGTSGGLTGLTSLIGGTGTGVPSVPNPGTAVEKASKILSDCGIDGQEFLITSQNSNLKQYCGCDRRDVFTPAFCYVNCAQKGQTVKDIEQLIKVFQGQIEPRQEESFFCNGCF